MNKTRLGYNIAETLYHNDRAVLIVLVGTGLPTMLIVGVYMPQINSVSDSEYMAEFGCVGLQLQPISDQKIQDRQAKCDPRRGLECTTIGSKDTKERTTISGGHGVDGTKAIVYTHTNV